MLRPLDRISEIRTRLEKRLRGKADLIEFSIAAFLARGHLLLEGPPGTGKTSLSKGLAQAFGGTFHRIQMTSDLFPSDIVGILRLRPGAQDFEFKPGPIFANFVLADELNRTSPKTQSALLEAMAERTVTVDGRTHALPDPFFVVATQNPLEFQGVYPLAESQTDRFLFQLEFTSPDRESELEIYASGQAGGESEPSARAESEGRTEAPPISLSEALSLRSEVEKIHVERTVLEYATELVRQTRERPELSHGVSVRGGLQFLAGARALAFVRGREYVLPSDLKQAAVPALAHRLCFSAGDADTRTRRQVIEEILERVPAPR